MKTTTLTLLAFFILSACNPVTKENEEELKQNTSLVIGDPFSYGLEDIILFPVGMNYKPDVIRSAFMKRNKISHESDLQTYGWDTVYLDGAVSFSSYTNAQTSNREYANTRDLVVDIRNILFYDKKTGKSYPLVVDTLHILSFTIHEDYENPMIFYKVVKEDYNEDSIYTAEDPVMLYTSNLYGKNFTQITPKDEQYLEYTEYLDQGMLLIKTRIDANGDKVYDQYDETNFREMKLNEPRLARNIFSDSLKDSLRNMIQ